MSKFILTYPGNKYQETKKYLNIYPDFTKYKNIVEPFGGAFGFSRAIYEIEKKKGIENKKYFIYDTNADLIDLYNFLKYNTEEENKEFLKKYNETIEQCEPYYKDGKEIKNLINKKLAENIYKNIDNRFIKLCFFFNIFTTSGMCKRTYKNNLNFNYLKFFEFRKLDFKNLDLDEFNKEDTLFYLDPPYFLECSIWYDQKTFSLNFNKIINCMNNYNSLLIINESPLTDYIFKDYYYNEYSKIYQVTKKKTTHKIYFNSIDKNNKIEE